MRKTHAWVLRDTGKGNNEIKRASKYLMSKITIKEKIWWGWFLKEETRLWPGTDYITQLELLLLILGIQNSKAGDLWASRKPVNTLNCISHCVCVCTRAHMHTSLCTHNYRYLRRTGSAALLDSQSPWSLIS